LKKGDAPEFEISLREVGEVKKLLCYRIHDDAPAIVPAAAERAWMNATRQHFAYRCLPLTIANSMGWEILCPITISAEWNGGPELDDLTVNCSDPALVKRFAQSHFGHGILTFQTHYLFRTQRAAALWVRGSPNSPKDGIAPLEGIVETDWLNFTFTMNWIFTRPGRVTFEKDEPFCFITPFGYHGLDRLIPEIMPISANRELARAYKNYEKLRRNFNKKLAENDPETGQKGWQKWYLRGEHPSGDPGNPRHISKLRLAMPRLTKAKESKATPPRGPRTRRRRSSVAGRSD